MRTYKVNKINCNVYSAGELPDDIEYKDNWRDGEVGDWVQADDGNVIQVLRRYNSSNMECIGTCTGTYVVSDDAEMDTVRKKDIYSVSGKNWYDRLVSREEPTK